MSVPYKISNKMTDVMLEVLNLDKKEVVSIAAISNQDFSEVTASIFLILQRNHAFFTVKTYCHIEDHTLWMSFISFIVPLLIKCNLIGHLAYCLACFTIQ